MKKILDFLRKIGLLHVSSGDYISGEFDDRKDLKTSNSDIKNNTDNIDSRKKVPLFFWLILLFGVLVILISLILLGFSFWFFIIFIIWVLLIIFIKKSLILGTFVFKTFFIYIIVSIVVSFFIIIFTMDTTSSGKYTIVETTNYNIISDHNESVGNIILSKKKDNSGNFVFQAKYNFVINTDLKNDELCLSWGNNCGGVYSYKYIGNLETSKPEKFENPGNTGELTYENVNNGMSPVSLFKNSFTKTYNSLDEFLSANIYKLIDGSKFMYRKSIVTEELSDGSTSTTDTWIMDQDKALENGRVAREYKFNVDEIN